MYLYIHVSYPDTGFRGGPCDAAMRDVSQPPVEQEPERRDPSPCPDDEEFLVRPDAAHMGEAIGKFLDGLEGQEHRLIATLPVPAPKESREMNLGGQVPARSE